ncbi:hypothetical protein LINPERHAP1_LOCUS30150, partial [Linum perenne]
PNDFRATLQVAITPSHDPLLRHALRNSGGPLLVQEIPAKLVGGSGSVHYHDYSV